jgi:hypothetical protein
MSKMIQVRNVPDRLHRELVRRARARGETLTQYVQRILEREIARPRFRSFSSGCAAGRRWSWIVQPVS